MLFMFGNPVTKSWEVFWEQLSRISINRKAPWLMIIYFNELMGNHKTKGGNMRVTISFVPLNHMIWNFGMLEFPCLSRLHQKKHLIRLIIWPIFPLIFFIHAALESNFFLSCICRITFNFFFWSKAYPSIFCLDS